ncbi:MAG: hypothetical protein HQ485_05195 [Acidobacteria bacterium]|nr:hypothetical protein [Acidobacteriota bacterium]
MVTRCERRWIRQACLVAILVSAGSARFAAVSDQEQGGRSASEARALPSGAELVAKYVTAIGGSAAIRAMTSFRATGVTEFPAQNMKGTFEMIGGRPNKAIVRMELSGIGTFETGYNGSVGWMLDPMVGPSLVTGPQLAEMRDESYLEAALHPAELIKSVTTTARTTFDDRAAYKAHVVFVSGQERDQYFDVETGWLLGMQGDSHTEMGVVPMMTTLRDYKAFGPMMHPTRMIQAADGFEQHFVVDTYEYGTVPADAFEPPTLIKAMIKLEPAWRPEALASFDEAWTTINESFYDPTFGGLDWSAIRDELRPRAASATTPAEARRAIVEMLGRLKRSHFVLLSTSADADSAAAAPAGSATIGIDLRVLGRDVVVTRVPTGSAADRAGVSPGQILLSVDDQSAGSWWSAEPLDADPRVTARHVWQRAGRSLRGPVGAAAVRVRDEHGERVLQVPRALEDGPRVAIGDLPTFVTRVTTRVSTTPGGRVVGVIGFNVWVPQVNDPVARAVDEYRSAEGLVIDLRGNPGGLAAMIRGVAGHLFSTPELLGRMKTRTSDLEFRANPRVVTPDGERVEPYAGPVAILVDELTASASECFAGALQSLGRARVFGRQTMGQALPASTRRLPSGDLLMYAVGDFVTATGQRLEGDGVAPDERVPLSIDDLRAGHDGPLEAALRWFDRL